MKAPSLPGLLALLLCSTASAGEGAGPVPETRLRWQGEAWAGGGWLGLAAAGDETRYEAAWGLIELSLHPLWMPTGTLERPAPLEVGPYAGLELLAFSSRSYEGWRLSPGLGLELRWSDPLPVTGVAWSITLRPHVTPSFERSQVSQPGGEQRLDTVLASCDLFASLYRLPPLAAEPSPAPSTLLLPEVHLRLALDVDLDPAERELPTGAAGASAPARRRLGAGGAGGAGPPGGGGGSVSPGSPALEADTRDLTRLQVELTTYAVRWDWPAFGLALGCTAGFSRARAYYYLGVEDGDPVHSPWVGPLLRARAGDAVWVIAACPVLYEVETDRWGPGPSISLLWAF